VESTHPALARAILLMERRRYRLAEEELRRALADEPQSAVVQAYLALCLAEDPARAREALETAVWATVHDPLLPTGWYVLSQVESRHATWEQAEHSGRIALGLAPELPALLVHMAQLMQTRERYREGLEFAERALAVAPDDVAALMTAGSLRSRVGGHDEAKEDFERALARAPNDHAVQANAGWAALRRGDAEAGVRHFRASLRLEPGEASAQRGMLEALRAHNAAYRVFLRIALKLSRLPALVKWVAIMWAIGLLAYVSLGEANPWVLLPIQIPVIAATIFAWTARPLADLLVMVDPAGRAVLDPVHKGSAVAVGALLAAGALLGGAVLAGAPRGTGLAAIFAVLFTIPATAAPRAAAGWPRAVLAALTALLAVSATLAVVPWARGDNKGAGLWLALTVGGTVWADLIAEALPKRR
jgi:tetratricopeptide (TPR) repeat protein